MRIAIISILCLCSSAVIASNKILDVGLYWGEEPTEVTVQTSLGSFSVYGNGKDLIELKKSTLLHIKSENGLLHVRTSSADLGSFYKVEINRNSWGNTLKIQRKGRSAFQEYHDDFEMKPLGTKIRIINHVYIEHYVAGVVESEAGSKEPKEYYKVQAVICRTYALNNRRKHEAEGFQLCDKVHCQVYHQKSKANPDIIEATQETIGIVIVDSDINLVTAAFSSNCGGFTCNSEDVWSGSLNYLRERIDDNCLEENHSYWRYATTEDNWLRYLSTNHGYPIYDPEAKQRVLDYCPDHRDHTLGLNQNQIKFTQIRRDLKLQSAYFSIETVEDSVILEGHGYGHGVGLCQEGAMNMARRGFSYDEILHYYYKSIHLVNLSVIDFFRAN